MGNFMVINKEGVDISDTVTVISKDDNNPAYYRRLATEMFDKADKFYEEEILAKRLELTNEEWEQKRSQYKEMMDIGGNYEDKELVSLFRKIINFISIRDENPLICKTQLTEAFCAYFNDKKLPELAHIL